MTVGFAVGRLTLLGAFGWPLGPPGALPAPRVLETEGVCEPRQRPQKWDADHDQGPDERARRRFAPGSENANHGSNYERGAENDESDPCQVI